MMKCVYLLVTSLVAGAALAQQPDAASPGQQVEPPDYPRTTITEEGVLRYFNRLFFFFSISIATACFQLKSES